MNPSTWQTLVPGLFHKVAEQGYLRMGGWAVPPLWSGQVCHQSCKLQVRGLVHLPEQVESQGWGDPQAAHARVHIQMHVGLHFHHAGQFLQRPTAVHRMDSHVDFVPQASGQLLFHHGSQNQNGCLEPSLTELEGLLGASHPQGTYPTTQCMMGNGDGSVAISILLDHQHDPHPGARPLAYRTQVLCQGIEVDFSPCAEAVHRLQDSDRSGVIKAASPSRIQPRSKAPSTRIWALTMPPNGRILFGPIRTSHFRPDTLGAPLPTLGKAINIMAKKARKKAKKKATRKKAGKKKAIEVFRLQRQIKTLKHTPLPDSLFRVSKSLNRLKAK